ncbi:MAG: MFS transporter [Gemmatimonadota bacterium]|nr:MFS transporter [Gemmatimonadota bacterium]
MSEPASPVAERHDPYAALRHRDYRLYFLGRLLLVIGAQSQSVAVGWEVYERTRSSFALGLIGLVLGLPVIALALPGGHLADNHDRRLLVTISGLVMALSALSLAAISHWRGPVPLIFVALFIDGVAAAFNYPARISLLPQIVPREHFASAVTWSSTAFLVSAAIGPVVGGLIIARTHGASPVYLLDFALVLVFIALILGIRGRRKLGTAEKMTLASLAAGFHFVRDTEVILAAITLDLFAVLLGGATALLPIFAKDILRVGPDGLGWLRAAPSVGALISAVVIAHLPPMRGAGRKLFLAVVGFGLATIVFGLSKSFALSIAMLFTLGALDAISMVIRSTLVQVRTPDIMRGRVSAVNGMFVDTSNELGAFESGAVASLVGPVASVVAGGIGTLLSVVFIMRKWPALLRLDSLQSDEDAISEGKEP